MVERSAYLGAAAFVATVVVLSLLISGDSAVTKSGLLAQTAVRAPTTQVGVNRQTVPVGIRSQAGARVTVVPESATPYEAGSRYAAKRSSPLSATAEDATFEVVEAEQTTSTMGSVPVAMFFMAIFGGIAFALKSLMRPDYTEIPDQRVAAMSVFGSNYEGTKRGDRTVAHASRSQVGRWRGMDADVDFSDDQQDIARGHGMVDPLFQGNQGTHVPIMSSSDYISTGQRNFDTKDNMLGDYYISKSFYHKLSVHLVKNFLKLPKVKIPLILGVWGGKGQGKTFQTELVHRKMGISPIVMSAGELESGNAGEPAKLIRQRYREASDIIKKGKMCSLFINDLDAGVGRMGGSTQYTVNNQMVNATLMNIADNPTNVQLPGVYKNEDINRVPIICTGNDFSTLYAPLTRDGRMEKFYWNPTREDRIGVCTGIFREDNLTDHDVARLVDHFPGQSIDFFGSLRSRVYDEAIWEWMEANGTEGIGARLVNPREPVTFSPPRVNLDTFLSFGDMLVQEQRNVAQVQLAEEYLGRFATNKDDPSGANLVG